MGDAPEAKGRTKLRFAEAFPVVFAISVSVIGAVLASGAYPHVPARWMQTEDGAAAAALAAASPGTDSLSSEQPIITKAASQLLVTSTDTSYGWRVRGEGPIGSAQPSVMDGYWRLHAYRGLSLGSTPALVVNTTATVFVNNQTAHEAFTRALSGLGSERPAQAQKYGDEAALWTPDDHTHMVLIRRANVVWSLEFVRENPSTDWSNTMRWFAISLVNKAD